VKASASKNFDNLFYFKEELVSSEKEIFEKAT
jgi:hypothetical protein